MRVIAISGSAAQSNSVARRQQLVYFDERSIHRQMNVSGVGRIIVHHDDDILMPYRTIIVREAFDDMDDTTTAGRSDNGPDGHVEIHGITEGAIVRKR